MGGATNEAKLHSIEPCVHLNIESPIELQLLQFVLSK